MKRAANELLKLPMKDEEITALTSMQGVKGSNLTAEQVIVLQQMQKAIGGETEAAMFVKEVVSSFEDEEDSSTAVADALDSGDVLAMKKAMLRKLAASFDRATNSRELTDLTRRISEISEEIETIEKARERKEGANPLNVIKLNRAAKAAKRTAGA